MRLNVKKKGYQLNAFAVFNKIDFGWIEYDKCPVFVIIFDDYRFVQAIGHLEALTEANILNMNMEGFFFLCK